MNAIEKMINENTIYKLCENIPEYFKFGENSCPSDYGLKDHCPVGCETCWFEALINNYGDSYDTEI